MSLPERIAEHVASLVRAEAAALEELCAQAMILQDFVHLERLTIVERPGVPRTVASLLTETSGG